MKEVTVQSVENGLLTVCLSGEIAAGNADAFYEEVTAAYAEHGCGMVFDCAELAFIDSTTLGTFVKIFKKMQADGKTFRIVNLPQKIKKLFVICSLDTIMEIA